jgi:hypothetical protein
VVSLLLKIVVGWTLLSLFCTYFWGLLLARRNEPKASAPIGPSATADSEEDVAALLSTRQSTNPAPRPPSLPQRRRAQQG